jgi:drug/metabolite transporter (DMT)-like permease
VVTPGRPVSPSPGRYMRAEPAPSPAAAGRQRRTLVAAAACWGMAAPLTKYGLDGLSVPSLLLIQLAAATAALWALVMLRGYRRIPLGGVAVLGLIEPAATSALFTAGIARTSAASGSLVSTLEGVLVAVAGLIMLKERMRLVSWLALGVSVPGLWLLDGATLSWQERAGTLLILLSTVAAAAYSVLAARIVRRRHDPISVTAWQFLFGTVALLPLALPHLLGPPNVPSALTVMAAVGSGVLGLALPFALYNRAITVVPVGEAGVLLTLTPIVGIAASVVILGEDVTGRQALGGMLLLGAVALVSLRSADNGTPRAVAHR